MISITLEQVSWKLRHKNNVIVIGVYGSRGVEKGKRKKEATLHVPGKSPSPVLM